MTALWLIPPDRHPANPRPRIPAEIDFRRLVGLFNLGWRLFYTAASGR